MRGFRDDRFLDTDMRILYLGTDPSRYIHTGELIHYPVIQTKRCATLDPQVFQCTHLLFTSPNAVRHFFELASPMQAIYLAIGSSTASSLHKLGIQPLIAPFSTQEGMIALLDTLDLQNAFLGWPRSSRARTVLAKYLSRRGISYFDFDLYETMFQKPEPVPDLLSFDEIVFTSPSTVDAFFEIFGTIPWEKKIVSLGPITEDKLNKNRCKMICPRQSPILKSKS